MGTRLGTTLNYSRHIALAITAALCTTACNEITVGTVPSLETPIPVPEVKNVAPGEVAYQDLLVVQMAANSPVELPWLIDTLVFQPLTGLDNYPYYYDSYTHSANKSLQVANAGRKAKGQLTQRLRALVNNPLRPLDLIDTNNATNKKSLECIDGSGSVEVRYSDEYMDGYGYGDQEVDVEIEAYNCTVVIEKEEYDYYGYKTYVYYTLDELDLDDQGYGDPGTVDEGDYLIIRGSDFPDIYSYSSVEFIDLRGYNDFSIDIDDDEILDWSSTEITIEMPEVETSAYLVVIYSGSYDDEYYVGAVTAIGDTEVDGDDLDEYDFYMDLFESIADNEDEEEDDTQNNEILLDGQIRISFSDSVDYLFGTYEETIKLAVEGSLAMSYELLGNKVQVNFSEASIDIKQEPGNEFAAYLSGGMSYDVEDQWVDFAYNNFSVTNATRPEADDVDVKVPDAQYINGAVKATIGVDGDKCFSGEATVTTVLPTTIAKADCPYFGVLQVNGNTVVYEYGSTIMVTDTTGAWRINCAETNELAQDECEFEAAWEYYLATPFVP